MPVANKSMTRDAKLRFFSVPIDISAVTGGGALVDPECDMCIETVNYVYRIASDAGTVPEAFQVGVAGALTRYFTGAPTASQAQGIVQNKTVTNGSTLVPAGTALLITKAAYAGGTNLGEVDVVVGYFRIDKSNRP